MVAKIAVAVTAIASLTIAPFVLAQDDGAKPAPAAAAAASVPMPATITDPNTFLLAVIPDLPATCDVGERGGGVGVGPSFPG